MELSEEKKELLEGEIPTAKSKLEYNYKVLRELHKLQIAATERLERKVEEYLGKVQLLESLLAQTEQALAIKNRVMEQMVVEFAEERNRFTQEIQSLKRKRR